MLFLWTSSTLLNFYQVFQLNPAAQNPPNPQRDSALQSLEGTVGTDASIQAVLPAQCHQVPRGLRSLLLPSSPGFTDAPRQADYVLFRTLTG